MSTPRMSRNNLCVSVEDDQALYLKAAKIQKAAK